MLSIIHLDDYQRRCNTFRQIFDMKIRVGFVTLERTPAKSVHLFGIHFQSTPKTYSAQRKILSFNESAAWLHVQIHYISLSWPRRPITMHRDSDIFKILRSWEILIEILKLWGSASSLIPSSGAMTHNVV